jgi:DNA-binding NarL/FixJ family response regulator
VNLLVCDDHRLFTECLAQVLEARGHRVVTATHPDEALSAVVAERRQAFDVCVMDLTFPGETAFDTIAAIVAASPATRVVVVSASAQPFSESRAIEAGAVAFVMKDDDLSRVIDTLEGVEDGASASDPRPTVSLTAREREVLERLVRGERTHTIATAMGVSYSTARTHVQNVLHKLGVHTRLEAVAFALSHSLVPVDRYAG